MQSFEFTPRRDRFGAHSIPEASRFAPTSAEPTGYALLRSGPAVPAGEVESPHAIAAEIMVLWGSSVLTVRHLAPPRPFSLGTAESRGPDCDFLLPHEVLGADRLPLLSGDASSLRLVIPAHARGYVDLPGQPRLSLDAARSRAMADSVSGSPELVLPHGARARLELSEFALHVAIVNAGRKVQRGPLAALDWNVAGYFGASFMAVGSLMAALAFFVPDLGLVDEETLDRERLYLINAILESNAEREREHRPAAPEAERPSSEGGTGERAGGSEGALGQAVSRATGKRYAIRGAPDQEDPHLARSHGREEATSFGMIAILAGADPGAPTAPWGRDTSLGLDERSAQGNMWGDDIGDSYGSGGLGLTGLGEGAGGNSLGSIGLGDLGLGHGAGLGYRDGFGHGVGRSAGTRSAKAPRLPREGVAQVSGRLPREVIQRIVRQNYGRFRMCYEQGLGKNPNLSGRVAVRFAIGRDGSVSNAANGGSDLPDSAVVACVVSAFYGLSFPDPDNGIVTVVYPILFSPG